MFKNLTLDFEGNDQVLKIRDGLCHLDRLALVMSGILEGNVLDNESVRDDFVLVRLLSYDLTADVPGDIWLRTSGDLRIGSKQ